MLIGKQYRVAQRDKIMHSILSDKNYEKFREQERKRGNLK